MSTVSGPDMAPKDAAAIVVQAIEGDILHVAPNGLRSGLEPRLESLLSDLGRSYLPEVAVPSHQGLLLVCPMVLARRVASVERLAHRRCTACRSGGLGVLCW